MGVTFGENIHKMSRRFLIERVILSWRVRLNIEDVLQEQEIQLFLMILVAIYWLIEYVRELFVTHSGSSHFQYIFLRFKLIINILLLID